jgi:flagellar hook-associated protein 1
LSQVESAMGETSDDSMANALNDFWSGWKDLSTTPEDTALRSALLEAGKTLASAFNTRYESLTQIQKDLDDTIVQSAQEINVLATQIAQLNSQIGRYTTSATQPNDFLDKQDEYIDRLSELTGAKITYEANGQAMVSIGGHVLVQGTETHTLTTTINELNNNMKDVVWTDGQPFNPTSGSMVGIFEARDVVIKDEKTKLNNLAATVFTTVNEVHSQGYGLDDTDPTSGSYVGRPFFVVEGTSGSPAASMIDISLTISVNPDLDNVRNIGLARSAGVSGDGRIAEELFLLQTATDTPMMQVNMSYNPA